MRFSTVNLRRPALALVAGLMLALGACQDTPAPTGPEANPEASALLGGLFGSKTTTTGPEVDVLRRTEALASDEVARARVGLLGATLHLRKAGLTVHIPAGAAPIGTRIRVRAPAGDLVGYHFEPHGIRFALPVALVQDLRGTEAEDELLSATRGAYFEGALSPVVEALEIVPLELDRGVGGLAILSIDHFSGYVIATN